jgi:hypothetical protein
MNQQSLPNVPTPITSDNLSAALANELALGLLPIPDIIKRFGITKSQLKGLLHQDTFKRMVKEAKREWNSASNAKERIRIKAAIAAEEGLLTLYEIFQDLELNPSARLEAYKQITELADVKPKKDVQDTGQHFNLVLNLGDKAPITIEAEALDVDTE